MTKKPSKNPLGEIIRRRMRELGYNQRSLALKAGLHEDAVRNILRGLSSRPRIDTAQKIFRVLGISAPGFEFAVNPGTTEFAEPVVVPRVGKPPAGFVNAENSLQKPRRGRPPKDAGIPKTTNKKIPLVALSKTMKLISAMPESRALSPEDMRDVAVKACEIAVLYGHGQVTKELVQYLLKDC